MVIGQTVPKSGVRYTLLCVKVKRAIFNQGRNENLDLKSVLNMPPLCCTIRNLMKAVSPFFFCRSNVQNLLNVRMKLYICIGVCCTVPSAIHLTNYYVDRRVPRLLNVRCATLYCTWMCGISGGVSTMPFLMICRSIVEFSESLFGTSWQSSLSFELRSDFGRDSLRSAG